MPICFVGVLFNLVINGKSDKSKLLMLLLPFFKQQNHLDQLLVNLRMEPGLVRDYARFRWHCENGLVENINSIVREFKLARKLVVSND